MPEPHALPPAPPAPLDLGELYRAHVAAVTRWAERLGGPSLDTEDLVHEVFIVAQRQLPRFRREARVTTWLYQITARVVLHRRRKEWLRRWLRGTPDDAAGTISSMRPTPVEELQRRQEAAIVYRVLDRLGEKSRTVLILFELEGLTGEQIATLTGTKLATVWVRLHRARAEFLKQMEALEAEGVR